MTCLAAPHGFFDQELILLSHRYSSCSSCHWGSRLQKSLRFRQFKSDWDEIWPECSSSKCASIDGFSIFDMTYYFQNDSHEVISVRPTLAAAYTAASARCRVKHMWRQFLVHRTFVFVSQRAVKVWSGFLCGIMDFASLSPVHTGDYTIVAGDYTIVAGDYTIVAGNGDNLSPNSATVAENGDCHRIRRL